MTEKSISGLPSEYDIEQNKLARDKGKFLIEKPDSVFEQLSKTLELGGREQRLDDNLTPDELHKQFPVRRNPTLKERVQGLVERARHKLARIAGFEKVIKIK